MKEVIFPKFGFTQEDGEIVRWLKHEGDAVQQGEPIAEVSTDKINMEVEAPATGTLVALRFPEGALVKVSDVIATILAKGESLPTLTPDATPLAKRVASEHGVDLSSVRGTGPAGKITREDVERAGVTPRSLGEDMERAGATPPSTPPPGEGGMAKAKQMPSPLSNLRAREHALDLPAFSSRIGEGQGVGRIRATPAARKAANAAGLPLSQVPGSGPHGRVQAADVFAAARRVDEGQRTPAAVEQVAAFTELPFTGMRRTIANRLQKSAQEAPHVTFDIDVNCTALDALRARANARLTAGAPKLSVTAILVKACAWALARHPRINSQLDVAAQRIKLMHAVNIGVAVALDDGLIVPVVHDVPTLSLSRVSVCISELGALATAGQLKPSHVSGGTFTISNLGMYGIDRFTAIINPPESAILAVGRASPRFVPDAHGAPVLRNLMTLRLSADHRVIDGAVAAQFMRDLRDVLEAPELMLL